MSKAKPSKTKREKLLLAPADRRKFLDLIERMGSSNGGVRVLARLQMGSFAREHGNEACDQYYRHHFKEEPRGRR